MNHNMVVCIFGAMYVLVIIQLIQKLRLLKNRRDLALMGRKFQEALERPYRDLLGDEVVDELNREVDDK